MRGQTIDQQFYPQSYFSGSTVAIYFQQHWIDEIVALSFSVSEAVQPIYGFNSMVFDGVARGNRQVAGSLRINFRHTGYLKTVLSEIENAGNAEIEKVLSQRPEERLPIDFTVSLNPKTVTYEEITTLVQSRSKTSKSEFKKKIQAYQNAVWGTTPDLPSIQRQSYFNNKAFDLVIVYGMPVLPVAQTISDGAKVDQSFYIEPGTVQTLKDVYLLSMQQVIDPDGSPVFEDYSFIARDILRPVSFS
jgi:hypothetical protein